MMVSHETPSTTALFAARGSGEIIGADPQRPRASAAIRSADFAPDQGRWLDIVGDDALPRLLVVGTGAEGTDTTERWLAAGGHLVDAMRTLRIASVRLPGCDDLGGPDALQSLLTGALLHSYRLEQGRSDAVPGFQPERLVINSADMVHAEEAQRVSEAINRARAWVEQPANLLTPAVFADEAASALERHGVSVRVLGPAELEELGTGALLAVGRSSEHEPRMVIAEWRGDPAREGWDAAFVGKGLTFDAGGLNIKTRPIIEKMKFDMGGAASVLGAIELAASRKARTNIVVIVPMAENVIDGRSARPGDVVRSLAGLTVEIVNTDAEGRLVLADGITYAIENYAPAYVVDIATLTGMIAGVLHEEFAGLYASDAGLANALMRAGEVAGEPLWRMPLSASQDYLVDSAVADVSNFGAVGFLGVGGGSSTAGAKFLERFAHGTKWAHIDIAGTAWATRRTARSGPGATGFGVFLLDRWLAGLESGLGD
ncbi:leucyl aminopeptidase family protein [Tsuneonella amylolytica]|uniref:leucyl aminopeptidase family protein n=1 Tax=Tsuneonella amylolytica TaxID=2338327 RepID=UPI0013C42DAC|nr:leucyl aminopeptidase family protein [Tsuneonella amylolytica]